MKHVGSFALMLLACPPLAGIPGYTLGWIARLLARHCAGVWACSLGTFKTVLGGHFAEAAAAVQDAVATVQPVISNMSRLFFAPTAWLVMRSVQEPDKIGVSPRPPQSPTSRFGCFLDGENLPNWRAPLLRRRLLLFFPRVPIETQPWINTLGSQISLCQAYVPVEV
jgi:hypothetical protein